MGIAAAAIINMATAILIKLNTILFISFVVLC